MPKAEGIFPYATLMQQGKLLFVESPGLLMNMKCHLHSLFLFQVMGIS